MTHGSQTGSGYFIRHRIGDGKSFLTLNVEGGGFEVLNDLDLNHAGYLIDLLRNEKPLIYDTTNNKVLATASQGPVVRANRIASEGDTAQVQSRRP